jgi:hypothetical protein
MELVSQDVTKHGHAWLRLILPSLLGGGLVVSGQTFAADPIAEDDNFATTVSVALSDDLSANDTNLDGPYDVYSTLTEPTNGTVVIDIDGTFTYTPNAAFAGVDSFSYSIDDGANGTDSATATITISASTNYITAPSQFIVTSEDTTTPLNLELQADLLNGGFAPDILSTATGYRPDDAGTTPIVKTIPAGTNSIVVTGYSTEQNDTGQIDEYNDDYQLLNIQIDLSTGLYSGRVSHVHNTRAGSHDQYSWQNVQIGEAALSDPAKVVGYYDLGFSNPTINIVGNDLHITETHNLNTAYLIEYMTSDGDSSNFIQSGISVQDASEYSSAITVPAELEPNSGKQGFIVLSSNSAAGGTNSNIEHKGFNRTIVDLETGFISGVVAAEQGETEDNTVTYAFENYPLVDLRTGGTPTSVLSSSATIIGDTTALAITRDDPTIYIDANGDLVVARSTAFADKYSTLFTAQFFERTGYSAVTSTLDVNARDALFDALPIDGVDDNGNPVNELIFPIADGSVVGTLHLSWQTIGGTATNENIGLSYVVFDMTTQTTSGSMTFMRTTSSDLLSWNAVPFGSNLFGTYDASGNPLFESNKTAGNFTDGWPETALFDLIDNPDGSQSIRFTAQSDAATAAWADYQGNGLMTWVGRGPIEITGLPGLGSFTHGVQTSPTTWQIELTDIPDLGYIPAPGVSGEDEFAIELPSTGESDTFTLSVQPVADNVSLSANDAQAYEGASVPISITTGMSSDADGSEALSAYTLSNLPSSVTLASSTGTVSDEGGGSWTVDAAALAGLRATGTTALSQTITVSVTNIDSDDIDGDSVLEDGNNGSGADEISQQQSDTTFTLTINAYPESAAASGSTAYGATGTVDLAAAVSDGDDDIDLSTFDLNPSTSGNQNTITTADGVWTVDAAGQLSFEPASGFSGVASITFNVEDSAGNESNFSTVSFTVSGTTPVVTSDSASVAADTTATVDISDNISDANGDADLSTIDLNPSTPANQNSVSTSDGLWSVNASGVVSFNPSADFEGTAAISYNVEDAEGNESDSAIISVTVAGAVPVAGASNVNVDADNTAIVDLTALVADANNDIDLSTIDLDPSAPGVQTSMSSVDGEWNVTPAGELSFNPSSAFEGTATLSYVVSDDDGNESNPANIAITVASASPVADADNTTTVQGYNITFDILDGDSDANGDLDPTTIDLNPSAPGTQTSLNMPAEGVYTVAGNLVRFEPVATFVGISTFTYTVSDANGNVSNEATVSVSVSEATDTDNDGLPDHIDLDDDNDGIPDTVEGTADDDNDGIINSLDLDSDNDGITDTLEAGGPDANSDGIIDGFADTDQDGIDDNVVAYPLPVDDFDADGQPDYLDVDSDNDGLTDTVEAGAIDGNGDGIIDNFTDVNGDGLNDTTADTPLTIIDTDADGSPDFLDLDADDDGIPDLTEAGGADLDADGVVDNFIDNDGDGLADEQLSSPLPLRDSDGNGTPDFQQLDSDADGIPDAIEAGSDPLAPTDSDNDGTPDYQEQDSDADGIPDDLEVGSDPLAPVDTDNDGTPDFQEQDSDADGIPDAQEAGNNPQNPADADGNGIPDFQEVTNSAADSDSDGIPDAIEGSDDTDGDGVPDYLDVDSDNDGLLDMNEAGLFASAPLDSDGDGIADYRDLDSDNDGLTDVFEAGGDDTNGDGIVDNFIDNNQDGWDDGVAIAPLEQPDTDGDNVVDQLDLDSDNDGLPDILESLGEDIDGDGRVDNLVDANADGLSDSAAINALIDTDNDGEPNHLDLDSDGDNILDLVEAGGVDQDNDGRVDGWADSDADGIPDSVDVDEVGGADLDNDGIADFADADFVAEADTDGDGIVDSLDDDIMGDGYAPIVQGQPLSSESLPDGNANGIADVLEASGVPMIYTGLTGSGCIVTLSSDIKDPTMLMMLFFSGGVLLVGRRKRSINARVPRA